MMTLHNDCDGGQCMAWVAAREGADAQAELGRSVERAWKYLPPFPSDELAADSPA